MAWEEGEAWCVYDVFEAHVTESVKAAFARENTNLAVTVISGRLPAGNALIFQQTRVAAGNRKVRVM